MCWQTLNKPVKQVAEEDIPVFKIMLYDEGELKSFYEDYKYQIGELYTNDLEEPKKVSKDESRVNIAFHSYSSKCKIVNYRNTQYYIIDPKYNITCDIIPTSIYVAKVDCIIPKGSNYYLNEFSEYVSDTIKIIGIKAKGYDRNFADLSYNRSYKEL